MTYTITGPKAALITVLCDEDLEPHHIEIGCMLVKAFRDENNLVYWPLPDCRRTYDKNMALDFAHKLSGIARTEPEPLPMPEHSLSKTQPEDQQEPDYEPAIG
ncbi:hypothetical protein [Oceanospirillum sediminis]|uniref:Uncharacterized protein n=1 Tax=Oceanospirillum sediminis TaxID=2760088 RepID=A0A839IYN7_9GAMM|nr:hypothetical protein [Oceanospirillum sediminis]MBB1489477.1 hypothetical protein [Oceanospirillum sediminis]